MTIAIKELVEKLNNYLSIVDAINAIGSETARIDIDITVSDLPVGGTRTYAYAELKPEDILPVVDPRDTNTLIAKALYSKLEAIKADVSTHLGTGMSRLHIWKEH